MLWGVLTGVGLARMTRVPSSIVLAVALSTVSGEAAADDPPPIAPPLADVHLHLNWDQLEVVDTAQALRRLERNGVVLGVVSSTPPVLAARLAEASGGWVIPMFMPYLEPVRKRDWFLDERVLPAARAALASGVYRGLGEMHLIVGFAPSLETHNEVIDGMLALAVEFDVPASIHAEASSYRYFEPLCRRHAKARIVWAHAGGVLPPGQVARLMRACPNVWVDLSARDPMRYGKVHPITERTGGLTGPWRDFVIAFQDRVMVGSDPFFRESLNSWDGPNTGWNYLDTLTAFHRAWIDRLPDDVARKIRLDNAVRFFRVGESGLRRR